MVTRTKLAVILHADVIGSTTLVQRNETIAHDRIQDAFRRLSKKITDYGGITHELRGDALLAEFKRASDAVSAALSFQAENIELNLTLDDDIRPELRIGISLGEVVIADDTLTGPDVVLAQRIEQLAHPNGICISAAIQQAVPNRLPFDYEDLGEQKVKGFDEPLRAYTLTLRSGEELPVPEPRTQTEKPADGARRQWARSGIIAIMFIITGVVIWLQPWNSESDSVGLKRTTLPLPDKPSIAVLAFTNISDDPT